MILFGTSGWLRFWLSACVVLAMIDVGRAAAQAPERRSSSADDYNALVQEAVREFDARNYEEARALFLRAHALRPSARTLRAIGATAFELRDYVSAARNLEQALDSKERPLEGDLLEESKALLARSYGFLGRYSVLVEPAEATLFVDGVESEIRSGQRLVLSIGTVGRMTTPPSTRTGAPGAGPAGAPASWRCSATPPEVAPLRYAPRATQPRSTQCGTAPWSRHRDEHGPRGRQLGGVTAAARFRDSRALENLRGCLVHRRGDRALDGERGRCRSWHSAAAPKPPVAARETRAP
jgi:hypothetical protein